MLRIAHMSWNAYEKRSKRRTGEGRGGEKGGSEDREREEERKRGRARENGDNNYYMGKSLTERHRAIHNPRKLDQRANIYNADFGRRTCDGGASVRDREVVLQVQ